MTDIRLRDTKDIRRHYSYWEILAFKAAIDDGRVGQHVFKVSERIRELQSKRQQLLDMADDLPAFWSYDHVRAMQEVIRSCTVIIDQAIGEYKTYLQNCALLMTAANQALNTAQNHPDYCFRADAWFTNSTKGNWLVDPRTYISDSELRVRSTTNPYVTCPTCHHGHKSKHKGWHINLKASDDVVMAKFNEMTSQFS